MIKQKLIENNYKVITSVEGKLLDYFKEKEINQENLDTFLSNFLMCKENFVVCNDYEPLGLNSKPYGSTAITDVKDEYEANINYIALKHEPKPTRAQSLSFYLQEFLDELNENNSEIIQITSIQDDAWNSDYHALGGASYTQGILVVYKEK